MKFFGQLKAAILEKLAGAPSTNTVGRIFFRTDVGAGFIDDGTVQDRVATESKLPLLRRVTQVQLDDSGTGNEVAGQLPYFKGGTGLASITGKKNMALVVNSAETGYEFAEVEMLGSDSSPGQQTGITSAGVSTITAPANSIGVYVTADDGNTGSLRLAWGTGVPTTSNGMKLLPGVTEFIRTSADLKAISESGTNILNFTWVIK